MRDERALVERAGGRQPAHRAGVDAVLRGVDVQPHAMRVGQCAATGQCFVGESETGVRAHHRPRQAARCASVIADEAFVLVQARAAALGAVPVADFVAQRRAQTRFFKGAGQHIERAIDRVGRRMMVDQRGRAREQRFARRDHGRGADRLCVECPVEAPPHPLQDLEEVRRWLERVGHAAREGRVGVHVRVDIAGHDQATRRVDALSTGLLAAAHGQDTLSADDHVGLLHDRWPQAAHDEPAGNQQRHLADPAAAAAG